MNESNEIVFDELVPMLMCDDVPRSIQFYTDVLGFDLAAHMDDVGKSGWASLRRGRAELMLASPTYIPPGVPTMTSSAWRGAHKAFTRGMSRPSRLTVQVWPASRVIATPSVN